MGATHLTDEVRYAEAALCWAIGQIGCVDYVTLCLKFVEDAYEVPNAIELAGYSTAKEAAEGYGTEGDGLPPLGSFVFYDCWGTIDGRRQNWGHVGLSTGDGRVIHAWDRVRVDGYLEVEGLDGGQGWTRPSYIGWTPVARVLKGMTSRP